MSQVTFPIRSVRINIGFATYHRPGIIYKDAGDGHHVWVIGLSTKDYSERGQCFKIDAAHPDFPATGLKETSYTIHPIARVPKNQIADEIGIIQAALAKEIIDELGL